MQLPPYRKQPRALQGNDRRQHAETAPSIAIDQALIGQLHFHEPALEEVCSDDSPSPPSISAVPKSLTDVRMEAAKLITLPSYVAAGIVERLCAKDACTLAQVCFRHQPTSSGVLTYAAAL